MVKDKIIQVLEKVTGKKEIHLETPVDESHGDFSTNIALVANLKAQDIVDKLLEDDSLKLFVAKIEVAGPGFINFWLSSEYLLQELRGVAAKKENYGKSDLGKGKKILVEYSSPNIAKQFSVGHLRSTIIGQALLNIYSFIGFDTIGENHLGDWGTQFGMIIAQVVRKKLKPDKLSVEDYQNLYVEFNRKIEKNPELREEGKKWFKKLEDGDLQARQIWKSAVDVSLAEFQRTYDLLKVKIDYAHGESFYEDKMPQIIKEAKNQGFAKISQGALIFKLEGMPPGMLLKTDGGTTYFTRDLAAMKYRIDTWNPKIIIYEVGVDQVLHFRQVFAAAKKFGWLKNMQAIHIAHGHFRFAGKKMSTRKGTTVSLEEVLNKAVEKAGKLNTDKQIAKMVGIGAIKYFDLSHQPTSSIDFDWDKIFVLEGNSGPYLQYTVARTNSVLRKAKRDFKDKIQSEINQEEMALLRAFAQFEGVIIDAANNYSPNLVCNYLFDLAQKYNTFYNKYRIINSANESFRLALTQGTGQILKNGLTLLGIETPEKM